MNSQRRKFLSVMTFFFPGGRADAKCARNSFVPFGVLCECSFRSIPHCLVRDWWVTLENINRALHICMPLVRSAWAWPSSSCDFITFSSCAEFKTKRGEREFERSADVLHFDFAAAHANTFSSFAPLSTKIATEKRMTSSSVSSYR